MATTKVVIRANRVNELGLTPIFIRYTHNQKSILFAVGQMVEPKHWDKNGFVKRSLRGYSNINTLIERKKRIIDDLRIDIQLSNLEPTIEKVKDEYNKKFIIEERPTKRISQNIIDHWDEFVVYRTNITKIAPGTIRQYRAAKTRIQFFEKKNKVKITFDSMDLNFYDSFVYHLYSVRGCSPNSIGNQIKYMKAFMNWAVNKQKLSQNTAYMEFSKPKNPTQIFTLTQEQLDKLILLDISFDERLDQVRDMFCLCCVTGLRYSDVVRLERSNIKEDHIIISTKKTNDTAIIPLNDYSKLILKKYPDRLPKIDNNEMNSRLKSIGILAGFTEEHEVIRFKGGIKEVTKRPLHELLTTHMGRRSFITQSLERGMLPSTVMKLSTHRDLKSFNLYINTTKARLKLEVDQAWNTLPTDEPGEN